MPCRTYKWIVKGGEDVRTDERMEMVLDVCNGLLARHPGAASHRLRVCFCLMCWTDLQIKGYISLSQSFVSIKRCQ